MHGRTKIPTITGGLMSFFICILMIVYSLTKLLQLMRRHNPQIASFEEGGILDNSLEFNFKDQSWRFAFAIEGFMDRQTKEDPRYVKGLARLLWKRKGVLGETNIPYHNCTPEELDEFPPPVKDSAGLIEMYKTSKTQHLYCLDWEKFGDELSIWGTENDEVKYQRFEYILLPCNYVHAEFGPTDDYVKDECIADK